MKSVFPSMESMTSPGMKRTEKKTMMLKMSSVGMTSSSRLMI